MNYALNSLNARLVHILLFFCMRYSGFCLISSLLDFISSVISGVFETLSNVNNRTLLRK